jgi:hypothetical protein
MNVNTILNNTLSLVTLNMHKTRCQALYACVHSLLHGGAASVTGMGRGIDSKAYEKHNIKRADRLCSNPHLLIESDYIYAAICHLFGRISSRPIILVDWSDLDEHKGHFLLRASLAFDGRSVTLYQEVHGLKTKEKPATHKHFLSMLKTIIGKDVKPIVVTDAGFKTPWFRAVLAMDWDFVGRTRKPNFYTLDKGKNWHNITQLYAKATTTPKLLNGSINRTKPLECRLISYKQKAKGRHNLNRVGQPRQSKHSKSNAKGATDPWLLSTSLPKSRSLAKQVVNIYRTRMQIEEGFRDMKSRLYGLGFEQNKSSLKRRLTLLILIATLASLVLMLVGLTVKSANLHRRYQANSVKTRAVLSFHFLGLRAVADKRLRLHKRHLGDAIALLKQGIQEASTGVN